MAFNSTNRIRSVVVGDFEDNISPETSRAQKRVATDMEKMAQSARGFIKAAIGIIAIREIKQIFTQLISFASEHQTAVTGQINKMKNAYNAFMTGLVESPLFQALIEKITDALNFVAVLIQNRAAWDQFVKYAQAKIELAGAIMKEVLIDALDITQLFNPDAWGESLGDAFKRIYKKVASETNLAANADLQGLLLDQLVKDGTKKLKISLPITPIVDTHAISEPIVKMFKSFDTMFQPGSMGIRSGSIFDKWINVDNGKAVRNQQLLTSLAQQHMEIAVAVANETGNIQLLAEAYDATFHDKARTAIAIMEEMRQVVLGGLVTAFSFLGAKLVGLGGSFRSFFATMLGQLGDFAIKTGAILIAAGLGFKALFKFKGSAAVAAGAALIVLGGALKAISSNMQKLQSGSDSGPETSRDYGSDRLSSGKAAGNIYVTVNVKNDMLDPSGYNEKRFNEVSYNIGKNFAEQIQRGRGNV